MPRTLLLHGDAEHTWPGVHERTAARLPHVDPQKVEAPRPSGSLDLPSSSLDLCARRLGKADL
eukprot:14795253-Alexandrium_andersonii.AAC.1